MSPRLLLHALLQLSYAIRCASYIANGGRGPLLLRSLRALPPLAPRAPRSPRAQEDSDGYDPAQSSIFDNEMQVSLEAGKKVLQCKVLETLTYRDALYCSMSPMDIPAAIGYLDKDGEMQVEGRGGRGGGRGGRDLRGGVRRVRPEGRDALQLCDHAHVHRRLGRV